MKSKNLIHYLEKIDEIYPDAEIKIFVNGNVYDVGCIRSDGMMFGVNRNSSNDIADDTDKLQEQLRKARKKAKRWKRKYLELRYELDKAEMEDTSNLCNRCTNERCVFASGICRNNCDFFIAKESEE